MNAATDTNPVQVVPFPGSTSVVLGDAALAMVADALEFAADDSRTTADTLAGEGNAAAAAIARDEARRLDLLAEAVRASSEVALNMDDVNDDAGRTLARDLHDAWGNA